jgi:segregation and condensation protein B
MPIEQLKAIIEAALLAASQPLTVTQLADLFVEEDEVAREQIARALEALAGDCDRRGVELKEIASGFRYQVRQNVHPWVTRMWSEKPSRYSRALLETLALIAYRQPITRPEIEQIRGVVVSSNIVKTLEEREWIRVVGHRDVPGRPALFGTTRAFLDYFNLRSLDELPPLSEIRDMEDPQLQFNHEPLPARIVRDLPIDPDDMAEAEIAGTQTGDLVVSSANALTASVHETDTASAEHETETETELARDDDLSADDLLSIPTTADEAADRADAEPGDAKQEPEEYRA